jgi:hypothetical protein
MKYAELDRTLSEVYGVGTLAACPITVLWAAHRLVDDLGMTVDAAKSQLSALNARRIKMGRRPAYPPYGDPLF